MEGWLIILAIALLRGFGGWYRKRQAKQRQAESSGQAQRRPEPGDPDAFDVDEFDPLETGWVPPWDRRPSPPTEAPERQAPEGGPVLSDSDRQRQEVLQRLARTASKMSQAATSLELPLADDKDRAHPITGGGVRISHVAKRAADLHDALRSAKRIREALLLREVLGPPVAVRGPLRRPGGQPR